MPVAEAVLGQRTSPSTGKLEYRLKWKGRPGQRVLATWESPAALAVAAAKLVAEYERAAARKRSRAQPAGGTPARKPKGRKVGKPVPAPAPPMKFVVEAVVGQRTSPSTGKLEYRLKWKGYPNEETSWEPLADCIGCEDLIAAYVEGVAAGTAAGGAAAAASAESPAPAKGRSTRVGRWVHHRDGMKVEQGLAADNTTLVKTEGKPGKNHSMLLTTRVTKTLISQGSLGVSKLCACIGVKCPVVNALTTVMEPSWWFGNQQWVMPIKFIPQSGLFVSYGWLPIAQAMGLQENEELHLKVYLQAGKEPEIHLAHVQAVPGSKAIAQAAAQVKTEASSGHKLPMSPLSPPPLHKARPATELKSSQIDGRTSRWRVDFQPIDWEQRVKTETHWHAQGDAADAYTGQLVLDTVGKYETKEDDETLTSIAMEFGLPVATLLDCNNSRWFGGALKPTSRLHRGTCVLLPASCSSAKTIEARVVATNYMVWTVKHLDGTGDVVDLPTEAIRAARWAYRVLHEHWQIKGAAATGAAATTAAAGPGGATFLGQPVRRVYKLDGSEHAVNGKVVGHLPPGEDPSDEALFHVWHDDGDDEDLDRAEVEAAAEAYTDWSRGAPRVTVAVVKQEAQPQAAATEGLSDYERQRLENIRRNEAALAAFGLTPGAGGMARALGAVSAASAMSSPKRPWKRRTLQQGDHHTRARSKVSTRTGGVPSDAGHEEGGMAPKRAKLEPHSSSRGHVGDALPRRRSAFQLYMHEKVPAVKAAARPNTPHMVSFSAAARSWKTLTAEETEMWQRRAFLANQEPQQRWAKKKARQRPRRQQIGGSDGWQRQQEVTAFQMYMHEKVPALKAVASPNTPHSVSFGAASKGWKTLSTEETEMWQRRAAMANQEHQRQREKKEQRMQEQQERPQTQKEEEPQEMEQIAPDQVSVPALTDTGAFTASVWAQPVVDESNENFQAMFAAREAIASIADSGSIYDSHVSNENFAAMFASRHAQQPVQEQQQPVHEHEQQRHQLPANGIEPVAAEVMEELVSTVIHLRGWQ